MFKKLMSLIVMCLFVFTQNSVFATSVSDLYGIKYTGDTEWKEEDLQKGREQIISKSPMASGSASDIKLNVNNENIVFPDQQPIVIEGRTFIPLRFLAEALGAEVNWDQEHQLVIIENKGIQVTENSESFTRYYLRIGDPQMVYAEHNKKSGFVIDIHIFELPQAPFIVNERTMLPFRYIGELLGALVFYDDTTHTAMAVYGQENLGAHLNTNYDNTTRKYLDMGPIPILSTLSENVFKEQLEILRNNAPEMKGSYAGTTLNGELSAAATWRTIDQSIAGYGVLDEMYGGHSNSDKTQTGARFFYYYLTNKYTNSSWPNVGPYPNQYGENITGSKFKPLTGIELMELESQGKISKSIFSTINIDEVLKKTDYWYYRLNNVWGLNLFPLNDSNNISINGRNLSQYKVNNNINYKGYPLFSFSLIKYWDKEMYRSFARAGLIPWINSTGHRRNLLRSGNIQFGFGAKYSRKESVYTFFNGPNENEVLNREYLK